MTTHHCTWRHLQRWVCSTRVTATIDDAMIQHYCNEDTFLLEIRQAEQDGAYHITLIEVGD